MKCPICSIGLNDQRLEACPQCRSDLKIHGLLNDLRQSITTKNIPPKIQDGFSMNAIKENADNFILPSTNQKPQSPQSILWAASVMLLLGLVILGIVCFQMFQLREAQERLVEVIQKQTNLTAEVAKQKALESPDLMVSLTSSLQKMVELYGYERAERVLSTDRMSIAQKETNAQIPPASIKK